MTRQKWRLHWGLIRGLSLTQLYLIYGAITYLTKTKIKDGNTCIYVLLLLCPFFVSGEIKSYTQTWEKYKIGRWYHSPRPRVLFGFGTCDNPTQRRDFGSILVNVSTHVWHTIFEGLSKLRTLVTLNPSWPFRTYCGG